MLKASEKITVFCSGLKSAQELANDPKTFDACIRSFQILGDAVAHPWKICPRGEVYVREAQIRTHERSGSIVDAHTRRDHCRECPNAWKHVLSANEIREISLNRMTELPSKSIDLKFGEIGIRYDAWIKG